jgi:hypothetical protein
MNFRTFVSFVLIINHTLTAQTLAVAQAPTISTPAVKKSNIIKSSSTDTVFFKLEMNGCLYNFQKNNLPFYSVSKTTPYNESAEAKLVIVKTEIVAEPHASVIRKYFAKYLKSDFTLERRASLSKNENLNHHSLVPFRINSQNQVEELIDYTIQWQVHENENNRARSAGNNFKQSSVLASGNWYKIAITQDGIHKITSAFLTSLGINVKTLDPRTIRIFGNGGHMVPEKNSSPRSDDLEENPIFVSPEAAQSFGISGFILFYATGTTEWVKTNSTNSVKYRHIKSYYSDTSFYYINVGDGTGKRINTVSSLTGAASRYTNTYDYYTFHEENLFNFGKTGREFYGEYFDVNDSYRFLWSDGDFVVGDSISTEATILGQYKDPPQFSLTGNGLNLVITVPAHFPNVYADFAEIASGSQAVLNQNPAEIAITVSRVTPRSLGWIDKFTVNARRYLRVSSKQFKFRDSRVTGPGTCNFTIGNPAVLALQIWNVTDPLNPFIQQFNNGTTTVDFTALAETEQEYCVAPGIDYYTPIYVGKVPNQNLHALEKADYVIVTHPLFIHEAQRLGDFHFKNDGLSYVIATTDQIYNEFSSGRNDPSAIRDFIRMLYSRNISAGEQVKYALLMGDGSYNNKSRNLVNNSNLIPTYQSHVSLSSTSSIATDDFYGLMDDDEGEFAENIGVVDVGIGRFTCRTVNEVRGVVDKIIHYYTQDPNFEVTTATAENCNNLNESAMGDWRNWLLFVGDDEENALLMKYSNELAEAMKNKDPNFNCDKILLDAYQRVSTPGGARYPDAQQDYVKRIKKGALIFNYTGHGGEVGLTAERLIDLDIINNFDNYNRLALFITATCEFSRYDDPQRTSAGELCLLNPKGGAIALMTTCRLAFAQSNQALNLLLLDYLFTRNPDGRWPTLGDVMQRTKAGLGGQSSDLAIFHLLGDPAVRLSYPENSVSTSKINDIAVSTTSSDTMSALRKITVTGFVADRSGNKINNFNGLVYPTVFDKEQTVTCLLNTEASSVSQTDGIPFVFKLQKNMLYHGKSRVVNGDFSFTFIVPKDISFSPGPGKISYYATNGVTDANGTYSNVVVGGDSHNVLADDNGPQITIFLNDKNFVPGGLTNEKPVFYADLTDSSGINTVGTGLGHDISLVLDDNTSKPVILNDYYEANLNSYQSGRVRYPFDKLSEGEHRLTFKVWDIQDNSNTMFTDFIVAESAELALKQVLNYPNPFTTSTKFMFQHNQACNPLKVTIQVYTVTGKIVKTIQKSILCEGYRPEPIEWDGRDDFGDKLGRGVYIYRLAILDINNKKAEKIEKLVILN